MSRGGFGARKFARDRSHYTRPAEVIAQPLAPLEVGDVVIDLGVLRATGVSVRGTVVELRTIDGEACAVVRGGGTDPEHVWVTCKPVTKFRRASEVSS